MMADLITGSPDFAGVHFTGSTEVFKSLWQTTAQRLDTFVPPPPHYSQVPSPILALCVALVSA
jgi:hypothetical protein